MKARNLLQTAELVRIEGAHWLDRYSSTWYKVFCASDSSPALLFVAWNL